jgi:uncharacterized membrane protein YfcA
MIVPGLALTGGLDLLEAAAAGLLPIAAFAGAVVSQYLAAGDVSLVPAVVMVLPGVAGGAFGIAWARRLPRQVLQRVFAAVLVVIGVYMAAA